MKNYKNILVGIFALVFTFAIIPQLTFAKAVTVKNVANIYVSVQQGGKYNLPTAVQAQLSNNKTQNIAVKWNVKTVSTNTLGTFKYNGTVIGYGKKVILSLTISKKPITTTPKAPVTNNNAAPKPTPSADGVSSATVEK